MNNKGKTNIFQCKGIGNRLAKKKTVGEHPALLMCQGSKKVQSSQANNFQSILAQVGKGQ